MGKPTPKISGRKTMESIRTSLPHTPSESDDEVFDANAIVFEEIHMLPVQDPEPLIKSRLRDGAEHITMGQAGDKLVYANSGGHGILGELDDMKKTMAILTAKTSQIDEYRKEIDEHRKEIDEHQKEISSLKNRVKLLVQSSEGYLLIRRRCLDVYKRDIKGMEELKGSKAIREGNQIAHEGDALGDAVLFDRDQRTDKMIYRELYGLEHNQVLDFQKSASDDGGLFLVLDAHATMVMQGKPISDDLKVAFNSFLAKVEEYWLQPPNKEPNTPLGSAYYSFWKKLPKV
ncbi:hypothetical protein ABVK25_003713 [Lepraria finkii]|uniref:Uncharacterized protein n=1 Tax=Lepraria finkii TaxID=1340010 RepID=A0ABR4BEI9_9LECA